MSKDEQIIKMTDKCDIKFDKGGNITILGDCNGETINRTEIKLFDKVSDIITEEEKWSLIILILR